MTNLQALIDQAEAVDIDEKLKEQFDNMMSTWAGMDKLFDHGLGEVVSKVDQCVMSHAKLDQKFTDGFETIVNEQQKTNTRLDRIEQARKRQKLSDGEVNKDIQQNLVDVYLSGCLRLPMSPLFKDEYTELLKIYKFPSLSVVDYHKAKADEESADVESCKDMFYYDQQPCRNIYITGDAGVGKSSLCMYLSLLWSMARMGNKMSNERIQKDADFLARFDYLFYVTLRDTDRTDVIAMIVDQLFSTESEDKWNKMYEIVENTLKCNASLVILDGLDEWSPKQTGKRDYKIPYRPTSKKCMFLTTCRPYKIENVRLINEDLDRQVKMTGLHGSSMEFYVEEIVKHINEKYSENKNATEFFKEAKQCGLDELLCIPIITSHLVMVWLDQPLTAMSRSLRYGNIVEMLFKIAKERNIEFPSSSPSSSSPKLLLPDSLSNLVYFREYFSLLQKVCLLSFRSLLKQDDCVTNLVFTTQQLMSEPYFLSSNDVEFLCKIGILSKHKVTRQFGKQEHKLSFLHQSYLEFFAAILVSSFEAKTLLDTFNNLTTIDDVLHFSNFFLFYAGFSHQKLELLFEQIYKSISDELASCRKMAISQHYNHVSYQEQILLLHETVVNCYKESSKCSHADVNLKHEDFVFDDGFDVAYLKKLLLLNNVKSIQSRNGKYLDEFNQITNVRCLHVSSENILSPKVFDEKFTEFMVWNKATLHTLCIDGGFKLIPDLPVRHLHHLTSLSICNAKLQHNSLHDLVQFMSHNVLLEMIKLTCISCDKHLAAGDIDCTLTLNLSEHTQLNSLHLQSVDILCNNVNKSCLKNITLSPFRPISERIVRGCIDALNCIKYLQQLEYIYIDNCFRLDYSTMETLAAAVKTFPCVKLLYLSYMSFPDDVLLQLHPYVTEVKIELFKVILSRRCFHCFIESFVTNKSMVKVELYKCKLTSVDGDTNRELSFNESVKESLNYMSGYLSSIQTINITLKDDWELNFETISRP